MAAAALAIYLLGLVLAFGWRSVEQWRRTGDTGLRLDAGPPGSLAWSAKPTFIAALLLGLAGPVAGLDPIPILDHTWLQAVGVVLAKGGVVATLVGQLAMITTSPGLAFHGAQRDRRSRNRRSRRIHPGTSPGRRDVSGAFRSTVGVRRRRRGGSPETAFRCTRGGSVRWSTPRPAGW